MVVIAIGIALYLLMLVGIVLWEIFFPPRMYPESWDEDGGNYDL
jgi:hypothetical protein